MIVQAAPPVHLTYCLNVHPGETWGEARVAVRDHACAIKRTVLPDRPFGLGLRLSRTAADELMDHATRDEFRTFLADHGLYVFTVNGFPYGTFHQTRVKEDVYRPDWRTRERVDYTQALATIMADLVLPGHTGSVSTVPGSFKPWVTSDADVLCMVGHLCDAALFLHRLHERTGKEIHLGLEPEPSCYLETTAETVAFFNEHLLKDGARLLASELGSKAAAEAVLRCHVGVCVDTCHVAVQFEDLVASLETLKAEGLRVSKVQVSAALDAPSRAVERLRPFDEPVYLHQTRMRATDGTMRGWSDLPAALDELPGVMPAARVRVHFHVPLFWTGDGELSSTAQEMTPAFFEMLRQGVTEHVEIETYSFDVLPNVISADDVDESIQQEYAWLLAKLA